MFQNPVNLQKVKRICSMTDADIAVRFVFTVLIGMILAVTWALRKK